MSVISKNKTVLVVGGAGFIGSHICDELILRNYTVICLDNLSTGSFENIKHLILNSNFNWIEGDILNPIKIECDVILNFACAASPLLYQKDPINTLRVNFEGVKNLLELALANNALLIQSSTSEVYGDPEIHPQHEKYHGSVNTMGPRSCYDEGKRVAESLCYAYAVDKGVRVLVFRIFNTYGPRMSVNDGRVIPEFIINSILNKPLLINGSGLQTRSFCYIDDLVRSILSLMETSSGLLYPINLGNAEEVTVLELAKLIVKMTNSESQIEFRNGLLDDPRRRCPDLSLANFLFNKKDPKVNLEFGVIKTIDYFKSIFKTSNFS